MFASQLIYTGCGKDRTGDFSVWSKTLDITKTEENEIRDRMLYKRPKDLPFEPTQEEIDTLFPRKFAYFNLISGRVCLAQSVYIGDVYSDMDNRTGNYIIHAFVYDKDENIIPMNFIGSDLFRRGLTYEEWHDQDAPDELPKVEIIDKPSPLTKQDIDTFFDDRRISWLKLLLQAIINSNLSDQKVTFNDTHDNLKYWYKAISICLPQFMQKDLTFSTYFTPTTPLPSQSQAHTGAANTEVKIRNVSPTVAPTIFNYQQDVRAGKYSFDFESNLIPSNIEVGPYVQNIVSLLRTDIFNAIMVADAVGKISEKCGVDFNTALDIHFLLKKQIGKVDDAEKLNQLIQYALDYYQDSLQDIADCIYEYGFQSRKWKMSSSISNIYRFVFDYSEVADKGAMIYQYVINQASFGVDVNAKGDDYCVSFKNNAPFVWVNFLDFIFDGDNINKYFEVNGTTFNSRLLVFDTFVESMTEISESQEQKNIAMRYFVDTAKYYIQNEKLSEVMSLVKCIGKCGSKWQTWIVEKTYSVMRKDGKRLSDVCSPSFTLSLIEASADMALASKIIPQLIEENEESSDFIKLYVERYDSNVSFYSAVFKELSVEAKYAAFIKNVELYRFEISSVVTKKQLQNYYDDYFIVGKDEKGLFIKKLKQYLSNYREKECINESLACFDLWIKDKDIEPNIINVCVGVVCESLFSVSIETLKEYIAARGTQKIKEMLSFATDTSRVPQHYYVISFGESVKRLAQEINSKKRSPYIQDTLDKLNQDTFYSTLPKNERSVDMFAKMYLSDIIDLYLGIATVSTFEEVYYQIFKPICLSDRCINYFDDALNDLRDKDFELFLGDTVVCACAKSHKFNELLMKVVNKALEDMGRGKRKKFFAQLLENVPKQYEKNTKGFVDDYQKEHEGFLDKLFGAFGKKKDEGTPKDKKKQKK